jgi:RNA polymerase sigma-70 factor, ECF subfamily
MPSPFDGCLTDDELLRSARSGTASGFAPLLNAYRDRVYRLALSMLNNPTEAEDATVETFLQVHRSLPKFRGDSKLETWIHRVTINVCLQQRRKRKAETAPLETVVELAETMPGPYERAANGELKAALSHAIRALPESQRDVVLLHGMHGHTYAEVAEMLGCPVGTVKSRLFTAFRRLRELLPSYVCGEVSEPVAASGASS